MNSKCSFHGSSQRRLTLDSQDTNGMQYQLMKHMAAHHKNVTIVGDPDQSS
jgi:hypothetical protein